MSPPDPRRLFEIVERALELPESERDRFMVEACGSDGELLEEVRKLARLEAPSAFLEAPTFGAKARLGGGLEGLQLGEFVLEEEIGRGGMGVVYLARQSSFGRTVAVKVLPRLRASNPADVERFQREATAASRLSHPNLVGVLTSGHDDDLSWYAMEFVDGHDLAREIELQRESSGDTFLPRFGDPEYIGAAVSRLADVADGVQCAHEAGVLHRDIKPNNLLLDRAGAMHLADFGLAKLVDLETLTVSGEIRGTPHYMSPEQARFVRSPIGARTDVYSLSVVLYELLSLQRPFEGDSVQQLLHRIASGTHRRLREVNAHVPRDLELICQTGMARNPSERYATAGELAQDLRRFLRHQAVAASPLSWTKRARRWVERNPRIATGLAVLLVSALVTLALVRSASRQAFEETLAAPIRAAIEEPDWAGIEGEIAEAQQAARRAEVAGVLPALRTTFAARAREDATQRVAHIEGLMKRAKGGERIAVRTAGAETAGAAATDLAGARASESYQDLFRALRLAGLARTAHPRDPRIELLASIEACFPTLEVALDPRTNAGGPPREARLWARPRDPLTGRLGATDSLGVIPAPGNPPLEVRLPPGEWRLVVEVPELGWAEYDRVIEIDARPHTLTAFVAPGENPEGTLVFIDGGRLPIEEGRLGCTQGLTTAEVAPFWVDETEVSNGDYLRYLDATGREAPRFWRDVGYDGDWRSLPGVGGDGRWLDLPVVGLSLYEMRDFAEWSGMRLLTHHELEFLLRGEEGRAELPPGALARVDGPQDSVPREPRARYRQYVESAYEVDREGYRQPPHGLFHLRGNVDERCWGRVTRLEGGRLRAARSAHIVLGGAWDADLDGQTIVDHSVRGAEEEWASASHGFRRARSASFP